VTHSAKESPDTLSVSASQRQVLDDDDKASHQPNIDKRILENADMCRVMYDKDGKCQICADRSNEHWLQPWMVYAGVCYCDWYAKEDIDRVLSQEHVIIPDSQV